ncbi:MAG: hypothetical protein ACAH80_10925 [Alphaproteobacteria bacterium]
MANTNTVKSADDLLEQARRMRSASQQSGANAKKTEIKGSVITDTLKEIKAVNETAKEVRGGWHVLKHAALVAWEKVLSPVYDFIKPVTSRVAKCYMWAFNKVCYKKDKKTGEKHLSRNRAGAFILATAFIASAAVPGMIGTPARTAIGAVTEPVSDGIRMALFMHKSETMYLNDQHVVNEAENIWVVKGTTTPNGGVEETVLFKVKPSLAHDIWQWRTKGDPFFMPDRVVGPVAPGANNKCTVTYYGARWRIANWLQAYPYLLDVKCESSTPAPQAPANQFNQAVQGQTQAPTPAPAAVHAPAPAPAR